MVSYCTQELHFQAWLNPYIVTKLMFNLLNFRSAMNWTEDKDILLLKEIEGIFHCLKQLQGACETNASLQEAKISREEPENAKANAKPDRRNALEIRKKAKETMGESKKRPTAEMRKLKTR